MTIIDFDREQAHLLLAPLSSLSWIQLSLAAVGSYVAYGVGSLVYSYWRHSRSPLRTLPGPRKGAAWISGHQRKLFEGESMSVQQEWVEKYGGTFAIRGFVGRYQLVTTDPRATTHILFAANVFGKTPALRRGLFQRLGEGLLWTEGEQHRDQRRILNPAFGHAQVRDMTHLFLETSAKMSEMWQKKCAEAGGTVQLNALEWLSRATLDAIGEAGFDYEFNSLNEELAKSELAESFDKVFRVDNTPQIELRTMINNEFPLIKKLFPDQRALEIADSKRQMVEIGTRIVEEKKQAILSDMAGVGRIDKTAVRGKDLLSLLLKANLAQDLDPAHKLSDHEVVSQIPTFILAGHETTSNSTTWAMYAMATHPEVQKKLRDELLAVGTETPTLETLNALPYLDQVVRETLRYLTVVSFVIREATQEDVIPLGKPITDVNGNMITQIRVQKGDQVYVPIWLINRSKSIWGPDADKFRPERWDSVPTEASSVPGITPNLMTFLGGSRSCIGHRFAVAEMKALLFHIVRGFEFRLAVEPSELWSRTSNVMRPQLRKDNSVQLPMIITPVA